MSRFFTAVVDSAIKVPALSRFSRHRAASERSPWPIALVLIFVVSCSILKSAVAQPGGSIFFAVTPDNYSFSEVASSGVLGFQNIFSLYTDFGKNTKSNIDKNTNFPKFMKIGYHRNKLIHSISFHMKSSYSDES